MKEFVIFISKLIDKVPIINKNIDTKIEDVLENESY